MPLIEVVDHGEPEPRNANSFFEYCASTKTLLGEHAAVVEGEQCVRASDAP